MTVPSASTRPQPQRNLVINMAVPDFHLSIKALSVMAIGMMIALTFAMSLTFHQMFSVISLEDEQQIRRQAQRIPIKQMPPATSMEIDTEIEEGAMGIETEEFVDEGFNESVTNGMESTEPRSYTSIGFTAARMIEDEGIETTRELEGDIGETPLDKSLLDRDPNEPLTRLEIAQRMKEWLATKEEDSTIAELEGVFGEAQLGGMGTRAGAEQEQDMDDWPLEQGPDTLSIRSDNDQQMGERPTIEEGQPAQTISNLERETDQTSLGEMLTRAEAEQGYNRPLEQGPDMSPIPPDIHQQEQMREWTAMQGGDSQQLAPNSEGDMGQMSLGAMIARAEAELGYNRPLEHGPDMSPNPSDIGQQQQMREWIAMQGGHPAQTISESNREIDQGQLGAMATRADAEAGPGFDKTQLELGTGMPPIQFTEDQLAIMKQWLIMQGGQAMQTRAEPDGDVDQTPMDHEPDMPSAPLDIGQRMREWLVGQEVEPPQTIAAAEEVIDDTPLGAVVTRSEGEPGMGKTPLEIELPFDIGERMKEWRARKEIQEGYFHHPADENSAPMKQYTQQEIIATLPHFHKELLLVVYAAETDEFIVLLPRSADQPPPKCDGGCVRIKNIMPAVLYAFRNRFSARFPERGGKDLLFLVSTGDTPRLSRDCLQNPAACKRHTDFAPILHFGSGYQDDTILPSLVIMPPPPTRHLRCMHEWQIDHKVCEFLKPIRTNILGVGTGGIVFGEHANHNLRGWIDREGKTRGFKWEDLEPQVVWRGRDFPYLPLLNPELRQLDYDMDIEPRIKDYGQGVGGVIRAARDVYDNLLPRWKAVVITADAEFDVSTRNSNPNLKKKELPWANMKFSEANFPPDQWNSLGIPAMGGEMSLKDFARFKYHIDLAGGSGTALENPNLHNPGTLEKLALPGLLFHHVSGARDWFHEHLVPWVHYVPVKEDLSDLRQMFRWAEQNDEKARAIAVAGTDFVRRLGRPEGMDEMYHRHLLKPLEDIIEAFQPNEEPTLLGGDSGLEFVEVMKCNGYNIDECTLSK